MFPKKQILSGVTGLNFTPAAETIRKQFTNQLLRQLPLVSMAVPASASWLGSLFKSKKHAELLDLYLQFVKQPGKGPNNLPYNFIEESLRSKVMEVLRQSKAKIHAYKSNVLGSELVDQCQFKGVFIHRKYNLPEEGYLQHKNRGGSMVFQLKKSMSLLSGKCFEKGLRAYRHDNMKQIYGCDYQEWIEQRTIHRYLYRMDVSLQIQTTLPSGEVTIGQERPTQHLLQVQSLFSPISNMQEFYLTDVDLLMKGNPFFPRP